jgi:linoleoyl-CoA desaturase
MEIIQFVSSDETQKDFVNELKESVKDYFKENNLSVKANYRFFLKAIVMIGIYIGSFVLILTLNLNPWWALLLAIAMGFGEAGIGMAVMHDGAHGTISNKNWVNEVFASTIALLGSNSTNWKIQHNILHHRFTNIYGFDPDIYTKAIIRLSQHAPLKSYHRFQNVYAFFLYGLMTFAKLVGDFKQLVIFQKDGLLETQRKNYRSEWLKLIQVKIIYLVIIIGLPILLTPYNWWQVLIGFTVMHVVAGMIMSTIFQMAHVVEGLEQPLPNAEMAIEKEWMVHQLTVTSNFAPRSKFLFWYAGGLNYQVEHHLFQYINHIHYPAISKIVQEKCRKYDFDYLVNDKFSSALKSHIRRLSDLGSN